MAGDKGDGLAARLARGEQPSLHADEFIDSYPDRGEARVMSRAYEAVLASQGLSGRYDVHVRHMLHGVYGIYIGPKGSAKRQPARGAYRRQARQRPRKVA